MTSPDATDGSAVAARPVPARRSRITAITSGKGGVG